MKLKNIYQRNLNLLKKQTHKKREHNYAEKSTVLAFKIPLIVTIII